MPLSLFLGTLLSFGLLLICGGCFLLAQTSASQRRRRLLQRLAGNWAMATETPADMPPDLRREDQAPLWLRVLPDQLAETANALGSEMRRIGPLLMIGIPLLVAILLQTSLRLNLVLGLMAGLALAAMVWLAIARFRVARRRAAIDAALPEAMDMIVRALRVGLPVGAAIRVAGRDLSGPLAEEFSEVSTLISYGQDPVTALRDMAERCKNQGLRFFAAAIALQSASGGNLAEVLERLAGIARARQQLRRKVRSITAEAKWSGRFLSAFPLLATLLLLSINPGYFSDISGQRFFVPLLTLVGLLLGLNILFMRWLVKLE